MTTELAPAPAPIAVPVEPARIFSGIQPSGIVHLGNDLGAIRNYVRLQHEYEAIYCIVDYHALTSTHDGDLLRARTREMAASLLALGLDPDVCTLFVQSHRPEHTELAWLLATVTPVSWLERTPTYKEKRENQPDDVNHGLLTYPVLQAADIVMYKATLVPVARTRPPISSSHARSSVPSTTAMATRSQSRRRCSRRHRSSSAPTASAR
jgi:tryptophanyl-tRNA synthetase